jgi:hypothetical protein
MTMAANAVIYSTNWTVNAVIPDNGPSGWASSQTVSTMPAGTLTAVAVNINLASGWTGDLYAYLVHSSGFAVLLDRVGTPGLTFGYGAGNLDITLADDGFNGGSYSWIHTYGGGNTSGTTWNPDNIWARRVCPAAWDRLWARARTGRGRCSLRT